MEKQFVTYELALKLKELGFNEECLGYYNKEKLLRVAGQEHVGKNSEEMMNDILNSEYCSAALWQQAFDWFLDKYKLHGYIGHFGLLYNIQERRACLEKLIEIVEKKNNKKIELPKFESAKEMVNWLMTNEGYNLFDSYGREWIYENYQFSFKDIGTNEEWISGLQCLHLFSTELFTTNK